MYKFIKKKWWSKFIETGDFLEETQTKTNDHPVVGALKEILTFDELFVGFTEADRKEMIQERIELVRTKLLEVENALS